MKRMFSIFVLVLVSVSAVAEVPPNHLGGQNPQVGANNYTAAPLTEAQRETRLLQYIGACIDQRRSPTGSGSALGSPTSSVLGTSLY